jgi:hypothetical protein
VTRAFLALLALAACGKDGTATPVSDPGKGVSPIVAMPTDSPVVTADAELVVSREVAEQVVTLVDGMPAGAPRERVIAAIGGHCSRIPGCVEPACARVLDTCRSATLDDCGRFLVLQCPAFRRSPGASAEPDRVGTAAAAWVVDRYRPVVAAARDLLTPAARERLDDARARHGL